MLLFISNNNETFWSSLIIFLFISLQEIIATSGAVEVIKVPEGICDCPKKLTEIFSFPSFLATTPCSIDSVHFPSPNGLRTPNTPKLFGVNWGETDSTTASAPQRTTLPSHTSTHVSTEDFTTVAPQSPTTNSESSTTGNTTSPSVVSHSDVTLDTYTASAVSKQGFASEQPDVTPLDEVTSSSHVTTHSFDIATTQAIANSSHRPKRAVFSGVTSSDRDITTVYAETDSFDTNTASFFQENLTHSTPTHENATKSSTVQATTASGSGSGPEAPLELYQIYDLDREKQDKHLVTVKCHFHGSSEPAQFAGMYIIEVTDINDHSPVFETTSLKSMVNTNLSFGDAMMYLKATDADIGENANLRFGSVKGTEQITFKNGTKVSGRGTTLVLPTGFVFFAGHQNLVQDSVITFGVTVKDRGDHFDGNRATATATISVFEGTPAPTPTPSGDNSKPWLPYVIVSVVVVVFIFVGFAFLVFRKRQRKFRRPVLVIDDSSLLDNDEDLTRFEDHHASFNRDNRTDPKNRDPLRTNADPESDDEMLKNLVRSEC